MTNPFFGSIPEQTLRRRVCALAVVAALAPLTFAAEAAKRFDLAADSDERALKQFSQQSGLEVVFPSELTDGVRANAVQGEFTPLEAARRLLAGTPLTVVRDDRTGVLSVKRSVALVPAPAPAKNADSRQPAETNGGTVVLSAFRIDASKDVGYRATSTTSGTRLNTASRDIPMPINVITKEFIEDIGAHDFKEALIYEAGITHQDSDGTAILRSASWAWHRRLSLSPRLAGQVISQVTRVG